MSSHASTAGSSSTDFRPPHRVETPEHVTLELEIAGLGSRALAVIVDHALLLGWFWALGKLAQLSGDWFAESWFLSAVLLAGFASYWGYFVFFEGLRGGQSPGKRLVGIRVVRDSGHPLTFAPAAVRNLLRVADFLPPPYLTGLLLIIFHPRAKRLGDLVAGTLVVRDRPMESPGGAEPALSSADGREFGAPELADEEFRVLREFAERAPELEPDIRGRLGDRLAQRFAERYPVRPGNSVLFLQSLYRDERERRRGRFGGRVARGALPRQGGGMAERLVARKENRWIEFGRMADRAARSGLDTFDSRELPDFAARYREVAADLARARTYRADPPLQTRLERLVAAGHNALYRDERQTLPRIWQVMARECPAAVVHARAYLLIAFLTFALPAAGSYLLLRERPALAQEVLPDVMLRRAQAGAERLDRGKGYGETEARVRPLVASSIISNNIGVAFNCFAGGVFLGVGSLFFLFYNGLSLGAAVGHFANVGLARYLLTFIVGHGVLELFAIWVAGAAGFLLGRSIISPGELSRGEALVLNGRLAVRMLGVTVVLLLLAGTVEGFVSTSAASLPFRAALSGASAVFLVLYLWNGVRHRGSLRVEG